jgi:signal transduction histidine kinase
MSGTEAEVIDELSHLHDQTDDLSNHIRQLSHELHPATLDHLGLAEALAGYVREFQSEQEIEINFSSELKSENIPFDVSICLYRIGLEALRNVARHSRAKSASVSLVEDQRVLTLEVTDSGVGFDVEAARRSSGLGLMSAEERVRLLLGSFELVSSPGGGTKLIARIPVNNNEPS